MEYWDWDELIAVMRAFIGQTTGQLAAPPHSILNGLGPRQGVDF